MKNEEQIKNRKNLAECHMLDASKTLDKRYHRGFMDALQWVLRDE